MLRKWFGLLLKVLFVLVFLLLGCSASQGPLTATQQNKFKNLCVALGQNRLAVQRAHRESLKNAQRLENDSDFVKKMVELLNQGKCDIAVSPILFEQGFTAGLEFTRKTNVKGVNCPVQMSLEFSSRNENSESQRASLLFYEYEYHAIDSGYGLLNGIKNISISGSGKTLGSENDLKKRTEYSSWIDINGKVETFEEGDVRISVLGLLTGQKNIGAHKGNFESDLFFSVFFEDFSVELRSGFHDGKYRYSLNGEKIDKEQFIGFFHAAGFYAQFLMVTKHVF